MILQRPIATAILVALSATPLFATDFYVDVVNGNNANSGTSPATAWQTLTFAAANATQGNAHRILAAPGTYSAATGESLPLQFRGQHVIGVSGPALTIVDGGGAAAVVRLLNYGGFLNPSPVASLSGFTLRNATRCIDVAWAFTNLTTSFHDLTLLNATGAGVAMETAWSSASSSSFNVQMWRVRVEACQKGITATGRTGPNTVTASDCVFVSNVQHGADIYANSTVNLDFRRCTFLNNGGDGVHAVAVNGGTSASGFGNINASISDCLFAGNQSGWAGGTALLANFQTTLSRCTFANNTAFGIVTAANGSFLPTYTLDSTLAWGNGTNFSAPNAPTISFSQIGGADPLFRNAVNGDLRVYFGSPVIDAGNPATPVGTLDIALGPRSIDGDLDTNERADIGCHEFRTLDINTTEQQGTVLGLEIFGAAGNSSAMRLGRGASGAPVATPFGEFDMSSIANFPWVTFPVAPGPGFLFQRTIPTAPIFIGQTYSFQGLVTSSASPSGAAWSNPVSFIITP